MNSTSALPSGIILYILFPLFIGCRPSPPKKAVPDTVSIAKIENEYFLRGNFGRTFSLAAKAAQFYHQRKDHKNEAAALLWMAAVKQIEPDDAAAMRYLNEAGLLIKDLQNDSLSAEYYLSKSAIFTAEMQPDSARRYFHLAEQRAGENAPQSNALTAKLILYRTALREVMDRARLADSLTDQAVRDLSRPDDRNSYYYALALVNRIHYINANGGPDSALSLSEKLTSLVNRKFRENNYLKALMYRSLANSAINDMSYDAALTYAKKELACAYANKNRPALFYAYFDMQQAYEYNQDFKQVLVYTDSLNYIRKMSFSDTGRQAGVVSNCYGRLYTNTHDYAKAKYYLQKSIVIDSLIFGKNSQELSGAYSNMGNLYSYLEQYDSMLYYNWKVLAIRRLVYPDDHLNIAFCLDDIARTYNNLDQPAKALPYQQRIEKIYKKNYGPTHTYIAWAYDAEADSYGQLRQYGKAIRYSDKALSLFIPNIKSDTNALEHTEAIPFDIYLPDYLVSRIAIFYDEGLHAKNKEQKIVCCRKAYQLCDATNRYIQSYTSHFDSPESVANVYQRMYEFYKLAADVSYRLYQLTGEQEYRNGILNYSENKRGAFLRSSVLNAKSIKFSDIPDSVIRQEADMRTAVTAITDKTPDAKKDSVNSAYEQFISHLSTHYPDYYKLKYLPYTLKEKDIRQWLPGDSTVFAEYMISKEHIYIMVVGKRASTVVGLEKKDSLLAEIADLNELLKRGESQAYYAKANSIYRYLVQPIEKYIQAGTRLIISADGILSTLSFEALTTRAAPEGQGFHAEDFLLNRYSFSYAISAFSLLNPFDKRKAFETTSKVYFSAPGFATDMKNEYNQFVTRHQLPVDNDYLSYLFQPFMVKLGNALATSWNVTKEQGTDATESDFKRRAPGNNIVQIGSHAILNNMDPLRSFLVFAKELTTDSTANDGYLYSSEIFNQKLDADLIILTACETGGGKYKEGEGMMSLSYSFEYAGCKSAIVSFWPIDEKTASAITEAFYKHLSFGESTGDALYHAKKDFLRTADISQVNPFYWSGLVLMGADKKIELQKNHHTDWYGWLLGMSCIAAAGLLSFRNWKRKHSA